MPSLFEDLSWRGLVHQLTDQTALPRRLDQEQLVLYIGFDPTAPSLHVGSLQQLCLLQRFEAAGHSPIALIGGGTGMIGDPSEKSEERNLLGADELEANRVAITNQVAHILNASPGLGVAPGRIGLTDNLDWLGSTGLLEFLRDVGKLFSVNEMVRKESVRGRLEGREQSLSFTEFSYMLLQGGNFCSSTTAITASCSSVAATSGATSPKGSTSSGVGAGRRLRAHLATRHQSGRLEVRQNRGRQRLVGSEPDEPLRVLPVLAADRRPGGRFVPAPVHVPGQGPDRGAGGGHGDGP